MIAFFLDAQVYLFWSRASIRAWQCAVGNVTGGNLRPGQKEICLANDRNDRVDRCDVRIPTRGQSRDRGPLWSGNTILAHTLWHRYWIRAWKIGISDSQLGVYIYHLSIVKFVFARRFHREIMVFNRLGWNPDDFHLVEALNDEKLQKYAQHNYHLWSFLKWNHGKNIKLKPAKDLIWNQSWPTKVGENCGMWLYQLPSLWYYQDISVKVTDQLDQVRSSFTVEVSSK